MPQIDATATEPSVTEGSRSPSFNTEEIWKIALEQIKLHVSPQNFTAWFKNTSLAGINNGIPGGVSAYLYSHAVLRAGSRVSGRGCRVAGVGSRAPGHGCRVTVAGLRYRLTGGRGCTSGPGQGAATREDNQPEANRQRDWAGELRLQPQHP